MADVLTGKTPILGLIALNRDVVIEKDLHALCDPHVSVVTTRIPLEQVGAVEHLMGLEDHLPGAARLLSASSPGVIAFGCTSAVSIIGATRIRELVGMSMGDIPLVDPLTAMTMGLRDLGAEAISLVTPYPTDVSTRVVAWLEEEGFDVLANISIDGDHLAYEDVPGALIETAAERGAAVGAEGLVIACTDLNVVDAINGMEERLGLPILTSNQALAWSVAGVLGVPVSAVGKLMSRAAPMR
jgi:maleate isomerase